MNELPAIGHPCPREELRDRQGPNTASRQKEMHGEKLFRGIRKRFLKQINASPPPPSPRMDPGNADTWNMQAPV